MVPAWLEKIVSNPALWVPFTVFLLALSVLLLIAKVVVPLLQRKAGLVNVAESHEEKHQVPILSKAFIDKFEERGDKLYELIGHVQVYTEKVDALRREVAKMQDDVRIQERKQQELALDLMDIKGHLREIRNVVASLQEQLQQMHEPIHVLAQYVARRKGGPLTPVPISPISPDGDQEY